MARLISLFILLLAGSAAAETLTIDRVLVHTGTSLARPAVEIDPVERSMVAGTGPAPTVASGWIPLTAAADGWITSDSLAGSYAYAEIEIDEESTWLLEAMGYTGVDVNGEPRIGNIYGYKDAWESWEPHFDFSVVPVRLHRGTNRFLFHGNRYGRMRARLTRADASLSFNPLDMTLPDLVTGNAYNGWGSIVVVNATGEIVTDAVIESTIKGGRAKRSDVPPLPPFGVRKVGFVLERAAIKAPGSARVQLRLFRGKQLLAAQDLDLAVKAPHENRRVTFLSAIDGSVQYFGYLPATGAPEPKALFLSLHGASVEAINQSGSYVPLDWGHLVAPTNRRPFGFSWEDWGRRDALEVLDHATQWLDIDEDRIYLTGHSMGGHGTWHLATLYPDRFAAVGPSAGWISIWSYRQEPPTDAPDPLTALIERGTLQSQTLEMAPNLAAVGVYVLHGRDDDNVPPEQAHLMLARLAEFHHDTVYHEEPDAGHWWDHSKDPGTDCVSWAPMFDFFARHRRPSAAEIRSIHFRTPSPSVSSRNLWAAVIAQNTPWTMSTIDLERDAGWTRVHGTTSNVEVLSLDWASSTTDSVRIELDGESFAAAVPKNGTIWLRRGESWTHSPPPDPRHKGPRNSGGFRSAFENRVQLVYGTKGTDEENAWALARARYDAEWLWYQGNASVDVLPDTMFDPKQEPDRSVVLYGHRAMHEDWDALVDGAVAVDRGRLRVGERVFEGEQQGVLAVRPRPGGASASVGIVAATGAEGQRLLNHRPYFALGVAYPDVTIFESIDSASLVIGAGYFGNDWSFERGEFLWKENR